MKIVDSGADRTGLRHLLNRIEGRFDAQVERVDRLQEAVVSLSGSVDVLARLLGVLANEVKREEGL